MSDLNILINGETNPMKYRMADEIASVLMGQQPEHAHMYALEQIIKGHNPDLWRSVLAELDRLEAKNEGRVGGDISKRSGELSKNTGDDSTRSD